MVGTRSSAPVPAEAKLLQGFAAALEDPKKFAKTLKDMAAQTAAFESAKAEAEQARIEADKSVQEARKAEAEAVAALSKLDRERQAVSEARSQLEGSQAEFARLRDNHIVQADARAADLASWESRLEALQTELSRRAAKIEEAEASVAALKAEWQAKRDKLMAALG